MHLALFNSLLKLQSKPRPTEDFFTEVVAALLQRRPDLCRQWIETLTCERIEDGQHFEVRTQQRFRRLSEHKDDSVVDLVIRVSQRDEVSHETTHVLFIESKLGSTVREDQLPRYADHLVREPGVGRRFLIYVTRDHDDKADELERICSSRSNIHCRWGRWHRFHRLLKADAKGRDALVAETVAFMEEHGMGSSKQFTPADLLALSNLGSLADLMEASLGDAVRARFEEVSRRSKTTIRAALDPRWKRYVRSGWPVRDVQFLIGFHFDVEPSDPFPRIEITAEVNGSSRNRHALNRVLQATAAELENWTYRPADFDGWPKLVRKHDLLGLLLGDDHVREIQLKFLEGIDDLELIRGRLDLVPASDAVAALGSDAD